MAALEDGENYDTLSEGNEGKRAKAQTYIKKSMKQYFDSVDAQDYWIHRKDGKRNLIGKEGLEEEIKRHQKEALEGKRKAQ